MPSYFPLGRDHQYQRDMWEDCGKSTVPGRVGNRVTSMSWPRGPGGRGAAPCQRADPGAGRRAPPQRSHSRVALPALRSGHPAAGRPCPPGSGARRPAATFLGGPWRLADAYVGPTATGLAPATCALARPTGRPHPDPVSPAADPGPGRRRGGLPDGAVTARLGPRSFRMTPSGSWRTCTASASCSSQTRRTRPSCSPYAARASGWRTTIRMEGSRRSLHRRTLHRHQARRCRRRRWPPRTCSGAGLASALAAHPHGCGQRPRRPHESVRDAPAASHRGDGGSTRLAPLQERADPCPVVLQLGDGQHA
jgi:hypothetical protein